MESSEFKILRKRFGKTQAEIAKLLGVSIKAIHSYEQGWRRIPGHVERQMLFLLSRINKGEQTAQPCWQKNNCPSEKRQQCPAWEFDSGEYCWLINGTICHGEAQDNWEEKITLCKTCDVYQSLFNQPEMNDVDGS